MKSIKHNSIMTGLEQAGVDQAGVENCQYCWNFGENVHMGLRFDNDIVSMVSFLIWIITRRLKRRVALEYTHLSV